MNLSNYSSVIFDYPVVRAIQASLLFIHTLIYAIRPIILLFLFISLFLFL